MAPYKVLKTRRREDYPFQLEYRTRWNDNDMYAHMNNTVYNVLFDSIINAYLIDHCDFHPDRREPQYGMAVNTHTDFFASIAFPQVAELGLRVIQLGRSSVHYEIALFVRGSPDVRAVGVFIQVFVDAATDRPNAETGMHPTLRSGLERILVQLPGDGVDSKL
ncbi:thioesterase family protein [Grosmannia clavigera kw1407]|uniref:Thioesterase family protein n=1 Tax=Grosmannia clavigera (strain kw1407 / UAMH 11150) TaxID=655863 RepID=F0XGH3_GROCL|nr:thioesterase family protein [Grosmannia clavigera kw1407]EFX02926.1 thioesterase family protein [Grosmannia clavigera kw1407]